MDAFLLLAQAAEQAADAAAEELTTWEAFRDWYLNLPPWVSLAFTVALLAVGLWMLLPSIERILRLVGSMVPGIVLGIFLWRQEIPYGLQLAMVSVGLGIVLSAAVLPTGKWGQLVGALLPAALVSLVLWYEEFTYWIPLAIAPVCLAIGMWLFTLPRNLRRRTLFDLAGVLLLGSGVGLFLGFENLPHSLTLAIATVFLALGLWLVVPPSLLFQRLIGATSISVTAVLLMKQLPMLPGIIEPALFWILAILAVAAAVGAISAKDPVYSALWFALCLLGVSGLFLYQGAFFLGIATVAVYAGAIVVTFLFVLMLAQPEGHAFYDRMSWGRVSPVIACLATAGLVGVLVHTYADASLAEGDGDDSWRIERVHAVLESLVDGEGNPLIAAHELRRVLLVPTEPEPVEEEALEDGSAEEAAPEAEPAASESEDESEPKVVPPTGRLEVVVGGKALNEEQLFRIRSSLGQEFPDLLEIELSQLPEQRDVLARHHVAHLGDQLFGPYLIGVEIAGALLLAALVGAVAIATRGDEARVEAAAAPKGESA